MLQARQKWSNDSDPHKVEDLVLVVDNLLPRSQWCMGRITQVYEDKNGRVQSVNVCINKFRDACKVKFGTSEILRPISKIILLRKVENL